MVYAESKKIKKLRKILVDFLTDGAKAFIQEQAFARYQKVYLGQFVFALNHLETKAYLYGRFYHLGLSLFEIVDVLRDISFQDIKDALDSIQKRYISTLVFKKA
ncbi:MAG: hypothetical protein IH571_02530 [Acholeplasmataceae bacterium]|nr:hypothetical protein [Acholeplasmataceae bacterium]